MMVKGKAVEVEVVVAVGGRRQWLAICRKENLRVVVIAVATMATVATVVIPAQVVMEGLLMVSLRL